MFGLGGREGNPLLIQALCVATTLIYCGEVTPLGEVLHLLNTVQ